jgi:hypothetical protein
VGNYTTAPNGPTIFIRRIKCAACGKVAEQRARQQRYCSGRCKESARNRSRKVLVGGRYQSALAPAKSANKNNNLQARKSGSSIYFNVPLNILGGGSFRWPDTPPLEHRTLENIRRLEVGAAP